MTKTAAGSKGKLFIRSAHLLNTTCARQPTDEELAERPLCSDGAYILHTLLLVGLIPIVNYNRSDGTAVHVVSQGALRLKMLVRYYGTTQFPVLCEYEPEENCTGFSFEGAIYKVRAKVLGKHLELDHKRPVSVYDCLYLQKRFHEDILLPEERKEGGRRSRGRSDKTVISLRSLATMYADILEQSKMAIPSIYTLERIGRFVMAVNPDVLKSFTDCIPRNLANIAYIFSSDWKSISDVDAKFVLEWLGRPNIMRANNFKVLFNAVVAGNAATELQKNVITSYKLVLSAFEHSEEAALTAFQNAAKAVQNTTAAVHCSSSQAVSSTGAESQLGLPRRGQEEVCTVSLSPATCPTMHYALLCSKPGGRMEKQRHACRPRPRSHPRARPRARP